MMQYNIGVLGLEKFYEYSHIYTTKGMVTFRFYQNNEDQIQIHGCFIFYNMLTKEGMQWAEQQLQRCEQRRIHAVTSSLNATEDIVKDMMMQMIHHFLGSDTKMRESNQIQQEIKQRKKVKAKRHIATEA